MPNYLKPRRVLRMIHLEQADLQKRVLMRGITGAARSFRMIELCCIIQGIYLVLQFLNLSQKLIHCGRIFFLLRGRGHHTSFVELCQLLRSKFFVILQYIGNPLHDLPEKFCFLFLLLHIASFLPFEPGQSTGSPDRAPCLRIQAVCQQYQHFAIPMIFCPLQPTLPIILSEPQILLRNSWTLFCSDRIFSLSI